MFGKFSVENKYIGRYFWLKIDYYEKIVIFYVYLLFAQKEPIIHMSSLNSVHLSVYFYQV